MSQWGNAFSTPVASIQNAALNCKSWLREISPYRLASLRFNHFSASTAKKITEETIRVTASSDGLRGSVLNTPFRIGR